MNLDSVNNLGMTRRIYRDMPGAPRVQAGADGMYMWGEVEGNEHYQFAERLVAEIMGAAYGAFHDAKKRSNHTDE